MNPNVVNKTENDDTLYFTLNNANVSVANAIRRTILSEIPVVMYLKHHKQKINVL